MEKIATCLQTNHTNRLPKLVMDIPGLDNIAIEQVLKRVDKECQELTCKKFKSTLKKSTPSDLKQFPWEKVLDEWKKKAPTFLQFLKSASNVSTQVTGEKGKKSARAKICTMAMAGATLLRARSNFISAPMYRNALVMQHGGAKKRCYGRFGRISICVTRKNCLRKLKTISGSWDQKYLKWRRDVCDARSLMMAEQCPDNQTAQIFQREDSVQHDQQVRMHLMVYILIYFGKKKIRMSKAIIHIFNSIFSTRLRVAQMSKLLRMLHKVTTRAWDQSKDTLHLMMMMTVMMNRYVIALHLK